eukprot:TRINITY_DN59175_c0_g1_i1.p1 TRINITY_DN59175_c0_g1~~TRINITY_DN59175_c0_g1_i1.p1  ORF type:complete len:415 (-),score=90.99 TRINITY_DN59175_c0_g1_i1:105-1349(-)
MLTSLTVLLLCVSGALGLYSKSSPVLQLDAAGFKKEVKNAKEIALVEFYAPWCGHCKSLAPEWEKAAKALQGIVKIVAVDATVEQSLASEYQVQGFPTIMIFGDDKRKPQQYQGGRTADAIIQGAMQAVQQAIQARTGKKSSSGGGGGGKTAVVTLDGSNFKEKVLKSQDGWMVEFFAPWCGHCKKLAPEWEEAARQLKGLMKVGAVDATQDQQLASKYGVQGYPTLKFFPPGDKEAPPQDINAARSAQALVEWAQETMEKYGVGVEIEETTNKAGLDACFEQKICIIAFLPHLIDTGVKGRLNYIETVKEAAKKVRGRPVAFTWMQGGTQYEFEQRFNVGGAGYPAVIAIAKSKSRYSAHHGAFSVAAVSNFVKDISSARPTVSTTPFKDIPKLSKVDPWDGKEYVPPADDEE